MFFDQATAAEVRAAADPGDAGSHWRKEKLKDLVFRAKALRVQDQPEIVEAIEQLKALTFQVEDIAHRQAQPGYTTPWWMDGDYDETRAEEHNDRGAQLCKEKKHAEAFDEFTEAVRLAPSRAVYHANRSSCALKLGRHVCARDDAAHAIERDPSHVAAHVRGANASLKMRDPNAALRLFDAALRLDPGNAAAARGKTTAAAAAGAANAERAAQTERARLGERDPLPAPSAWPDQCHCAESLLAAETVADANPDAEGPITARCEALVLCGRLERAMACSESLAKTSADRAYLRAEILWRLGAERVGDALDELNSFAAAYGSSSRNPTPTPMPRKMLELGSRLTKLKELLERGEADVEDGALAEAERAFTAALKLRDQRRCGTDVSNGSKNKNPYPNRCRGDCSACGPSRGSTGSGTDATTTPPPPPRTTTTISTPRATSRNASRSTRGTTPRGGSSPMSLENAATAKKRSSAYAVHKPRRRTPRRLPKRCSPRREPLGIRSAGVRVRTRADASHPAWTRVWTRFIRSSA